MDFLSSRIRGRTFNGASGLSALGARKLPKPINMQVLASALARVRKTT